MNSRVCSNPGCGEEYADDFQDAFCVCGAPLRAMDGSREGQRGPAPLPTPGPESPAPGWDEPGPVIVGDRVILPGSPDYPRNPQPGSAAAPAGARLSIFVEGRRYLDFTLDCDETRIGRRGHGSRPDIDLSVIDPEKRLSRRHLLLHRTDGQFYARNESGRGTVHVDGKALAQGAEHPLTDGAQLVLDKFVGIVFRAPGGGGRA